MAAMNILIVDDVYPIARALAYLLERSGYSCQIARNGAEALEKIEEQKPDLVFLDLQMPVMDGLETCRRIRGTEAYRDLYIIILTSLGQDEDITGALEAGANEHIAKPFSPPQVLERVREILNPVESP